jgi:hypothetical protein
MLGEGRRNLLLREDARLQRADLLLELRLLRGGGRRQRVDRRDPLLRAHTPFGHPI